MNIDKSQSQNRKIRQKILFGFSAIIIILSVSSIIMVYNSLNSQTLIKNMKQTCIPSSTSLSRISIDIADMERWFMDSSATFDSFGLDMAENNYSRIRSEINNLLRSTEENDNTEGNENYLLLENKITNLYNTGISMADAFISGDEDEAFDKLDEFSEISEELKAQVEWSTSEAQDEVLLSMFEFSEMLRMSIVTSVIAVLSGLVLSLIIGFVIAYKISKPIKDIVKFSSILKAGDFSRKTNVNTKDEIGLLAGSINAVVQSVQVLVGDIINSTGEIENITLSLTTQSVSANDSATEIAARTNHVRDHIENLNAHVTLVTTVVQSIVTSITGIDQQIDGQSSAITEATAAVEEMIASLHNIAKISKEKKDAVVALLDTSAKGTEILSNTNQVIQATGDDISAISETITLINNISDQTNLLAMNASIEAAHAGNQGAGFAVIAEEIRKLSESTHENSEKISQSLNKVVDRIHNAGELSKLTIEAFTTVDKEISSMVSALEEVVGATYELSAGGDQVMEAMVSLNDSFNILHSGSESMKAETSSITSSCSDLKHLSAEAFEQVQIIDEKAHIITAVARDFSESSDFLNLNVKSLQDNVDKFTIED